MRPTGRGGPPGFTLMELMVSMLISSLLVLTVHATVRMTLDVTSRSPESDRAYDALRSEAVFHSLREWLEGTYTSTGSPAAALKGEDGEHAGMPADEIRLVTLDRGRMIDGPPDAAVAIHLRIGEGDEGLTATYGDPQTGAVTGVVRLLPEARGMDVRYLPPAADGGDWTDSWSKPYVRPGAVEIRLLAGPGQSLPRAFRAPLLISLPTR